MTTILTDIEGTTSSISFVHDVLFPFAHEAMDAFVAEHFDELAPHVEAVCREAGIDSPVPAAVSAVLKRWIEEDRKATPLKAIQGLIWRAGYERGQLQAHVYADAHAELTRWHAAAVPMFVYSSGSVLAQKLFFAHTGFGDLTPLFRGYFDTTTGPKTAAESYAAIADAIGRPSAEITFLSDVEAELDAAAAAGMQTVWVVRDGELPTGASHPLARDFSEIRIPG